MTHFPDTATVDIPGFSFELPQGWEIIHPDRVLFCLIHQQPGFSPNTVVALERRSADLTGETLMGEMSQYVASLKNSRITAQQGGTNSRGQDWNIIEYIYDHEIGTLAGSLAILTVKHDGVADTYRFHSTVTGQTAAQDLRTIHEFLETVTLDKEEAER
ncbi:Uncharacterised protein [Scardovia inopinata]|uniref:DUF1795 domain-containing protein n=1 Tax=Scardovia inopinata F0304 TaxID=641146 RepID=W5IHQ5_SCAIO|nr:hypothetical protein [Scardovia inopinata]EFG26396.1 hypothetical protein HMPREF9020_00015 [Scardovia inopinata F0304]BAR07436.1 hypothetical protein SCIP_1369 [Scardovia inopinata JCM 12537]SUV51510.1 Uncharacterised protein [Scardovia inopinata]